MALTNYERVGKALELLKKGLQPYVERELKLFYGDEWLNVMQRVMPDGGQKGLKDGPDVQKLLAVMWDEWKNVFSRTLGHTERSIVSELRETRNRWAHQDAFSSNDAHRALDSVARLLTAVSASEEAAEVEKMRMDLLRVQFEEQRRSEMRKASFQPTSGNPRGGLKPWREVVTPHPDVASGRYQQAEFAADLWQVYKNEGSSEYMNPTEFYRRTYITGGLKLLIKKAIERLSGKGGDPVVELQTNFGGGKTHSMLALYHLFSGVPATELSGVEEILKELSIPIPQNVKRVVIVGTQISPGRIHSKSDGTKVRTLWGEIAWQLGGKEGYEMVRENDENATSPGDRLKELFNKYSPCIILIDEWVAYARQLPEKLYNKEDLPGGTFETQFTFAQALSESVKAAQRAMLVVSIPESINEVGGEWGKVALARLKNAIGRIESPWRPASQDEGFEIVRRRLFQPLTNEQAIARDAVARAFVEMYGYGDNTQEFPLGCREADYERRIKMAYPIHPELFERLYSDWSALDRFQRTRGVLRLMAAVIHCLWARQDSNLLIMPATIPIDDPNVQRELTQYLEDQWVPVIEKDVDGPRSLPLILDNENPGLLGRYSACRRVARTIYIGSAPTIRAANRGIDDRLIKLGCVQPGESIAAFGDALRRLTDRATYLYVDGNRYWYSTQPSVNRLAEDRAAQKTEDEVNEEIRKRLKEQARHRGDFVRVHACVKSADIPDERETRLVILDPAYPYINKDKESHACQKAKEILSSRGSSPRTYRNTLVFLAADSNRLDELKQAVRKYLAWASIVNEKEALNLDAFQSSQAEDKRKKADETLGIRIPETYQWLLSPYQPDPRGEVLWQAYRLQGQDDLATRASKKLRNEEILLTQMGGARLKHELDRIPLWRGDHVSIKQLLDDFATYLYLPKISDEKVLLDAISKGLNMISWQTDGYAYAERWDEKQKRYIGLHAGSGAGITIDTMGLVVKPEVAEKQIEEENTGGTQPPKPPQPTGGGNGSSQDKKIYRRFHGSVKLNPIRANQDINKIVEAVIQHLTSQIDSEVELTLEVQANLPKGADEKLRRDVTENCRTLKFDNCEFEET